LPIPLQVRQISRPFAYKSTGLLIWDLKRKS